MDNKSLHCKHLHRISDAIEAWHHWSERIGRKNSGLWKNTPKKKQQTQLFERHHGWAQTDIKARGATTVRRTRTYSQSEQDRLSQAIACCKFVLCWKLRTRAFAAFVMSKASYGWVGKWPTRQTSEKLFNAPYPACISEDFFLGGGAGWSPNLTSGQDVGTISQASRTKWFSTSHTTTALLRSQLRKISFVEARPFVWRPETCSKMSTCNHTTWGLFTDVSNLILFVKSKRSDARELRQFMSPAALRYRYGNTALRKCRGWVNWKFTWIQERFWSSANLGARLSGDPICPWCLRSLGTHAHTFWQCFQNAEMKNKYPRHFQDPNPLTLRLGWFQYDTDEIVASHICNKAQKIWKHRHPDWSASHLQCFKKKENKIWKHSLPD